MIYKVPNQKRRKKNVLNKERVNLQQTWMLKKGKITMKENSRKKKILESSSMLWHILIILYLISIIAYIVYFVICHKIFMIGFLIATLFMLSFELLIFIRDKIYKKDKAEK